MAKTRVGHGNERTITVRLINHVLQLLLRHVLTQLLGDPLQILEGNLAGGVVVEELENLVRPARVRSGGTRTAGVIR
jgi:hypothetical protein